MKTIRDHKSGDLFDPWEHLGSKRRRLLERSWAGVFREYLLKHLPVDELGVGFRDKMGRPSKDLYVAMGALILQQLHDLTDEQATEAVALNIAWHYALDIRSESDAYLCERTLRNYRRRVIESKLDEVLFRTLTDRLVQAVGVDTQKQRLDSTAIRSAIRSLTRLGILVESMSKFLRELSRTFPKLHEEVNKETLRKYVQRQGEGHFGHIKPSESKRRLPEAAKDLYELREQFKTTEAKDLESFRLLGRVFQEQCELVQGSEEALRVKEPTEIPCDNVLNPADPDASYNKRRGVGYMVQLMETYTPKKEDGEEQVVPPDLITHVAVGKMTVHDQSALSPALEDTALRGVEPSMLLADSHYGSNKCLEQGRERNVEIVSPSITPKGKEQGKLTLEEFQLDEMNLAASIAMREFARGRGVSKR